MPTQARLSTDRLPAKLREQEIEVLAVKMFGAVEGWSSHTVQGQWERLLKQTQDAYRRSARVAFTHILGTYKP